MTTKKPIWDPNGTYTITQIATFHIKPDQVSNLKNFAVIGEPSENSGAIIQPDQVMDLKVDGTYNRAVEDFSYRNLYENIDRRNGFDYLSASGVITFIRPNGDELTVAGVHRSVMAAIKGIALPVNRHYHKPDTSIEECRRIEAQVYTDEGYHLYKQTPDQAFKAACVAQEKWALDFSKILNRLNLNVKGRGDVNGTKLTGYQTLIKAIDEYKIPAVYKAGELLKDELEDESKLNSLFISGLSALLSKENDLNEKTLKKAIDQALNSDSFLKRTQHGSAVPNLAVRFATKYNSISKRKSKGSIDLINLCSRLSLNADILSTDGVIVNA
jgi:hypothetical protein|tara:strand:- start:60 stop:1043 length:984 start_codon:yes stop_codon:yes gene_type:complete